MTDQDSLVQTISEAVSRAVAEALGASSRTPNNVNARNSQPPSAVNQSARPSTSPSTAAVTPGPSQQIGFPLPSSFGGSSLPPPPKKRRQTVAKEKVFNKNIICLPPVADISKPIPIPRGDKRARLTEAGLTGKIAISSSWKVADVTREISTLFSSSFGLADGATLPFQYLSTVPGGKKLSIPRTSPSFQWNAPEVVSLASQGSLYIMSKIIPKMLSGRNPQQLEDASDEDDIDVYAWEDAPGLLACAPKKSATDSSPVGPYKQGPSTSGAADHEGDINLFCMRGYTSLFDVENAADNGDEVVDVIPASPDSSSPGSVPPRSTPPDGNDILLEDILRELSATLKTDTSSLSKFNISRGQLWDGTVRGVQRKSFSPENKISVKFTDDSGTAEGAIDLGGPQRELFTLVMHYLANSQMFCCGVDRNEKLLNNFGKALQDDHYYCAGCMIALSLVHGGPAPRFLSNVLYDALVFGPEKAKVPLESVPDQTVREALIKLKAATSDDEMFDTLDSLASILDMAGTIQPCKKLGEQHDIVKHTAHWFVLGRTRSAFERFREGLKTLGVMEAMAQHPEAFRAALCYSGPGKLSSSEMTNLFRIVRSERGSNRFNQETQVISYWYDYLQDVEDTPDVISLEDILFFATGCREIPPIGFNVEPSIEFQHSCAAEEGRYPKANTCACVIKLPVEHNNFDQFKENMEFGIANGGGYGMA